MSTTFQSTQTWQLDAKVTATPYGHHLMISSFVPTARRPEHQVKFSGTFSTDELRALRDVIDQALEVPHAEPEGLKGNQVQRDAVAFNRFANV